MKPASTPPISPADELLLDTARFQVVRRAQTLADGGVRQREVVLHPGAVVLLPLLPDGRVCLIRNYRVAVEQTLIELPAGTIDSGETPFETAHRELIEETGYRAASLEPLCEFLMSPGILNERMHLFLATGLTAGEQALEAGEQIERLIVPWDEALSMIDDGRIQDAKTIVGLLMYARRIRGERGASASY